MPSKMFNLFDDVVQLIMEQDEPPEGDVTEDEISSIQRDLGATPEQMGQELPPQEGEEQEVDIVPGESAEEQVKNLGRIYMLKKVYAKLLTVSGYLDSVSEPRFDDLKRKVIEALDIFHVVVTNFDAFVDKIDDILSSVEGFLKLAVGELEKLMKTSS